MQKYLNKILTARVYDVASETPLDLLPRLSHRLDNRIRLKREDLQPVFSFKLRGAYNKIANLDAEAAARGVICASAGNHAQGVALAGHALGIRAVIVMPETTPAIKVAAVRARGGEIVLYGDNFDEAYQHAMALQAEHHLTFVHPFDDPDVIAGQGTIGLEILLQHPKPLEAIFVAVGGGGLIAGIGACVKQLRPDIKIIGVEPYDAASMYESLRKNKRVILDQVVIFADGVAVKQVGKEPFRIARKTVDEIIRVSTDEICAAIKDIYDDTRAIAEPAGALGIAGLKKYVARERLRDAHLVTINCGANINFDRLRHVAERAELGEHREALLAVTIPEQPGSFRDFCELIGKRNITEFNYRYANHHAQAHIFVGLEFSGGLEERLALIERLKDAKYAVVDMSDNEMAKLHVRYMVGGRTHGLEDEVLYRFEFPERPGALLKFLQGLGPWNISLFHYRNHGSAFGRVLAGIQVPEKERAKLERYFKKIDYAFWREADNPAYQLFLANGG